MRDLRVVVDERVRVGHVTRHHPRVRPVPGQKDGGLLGVRDRQRRIEECVLAGPIRPHLVARHAVGLQREGDRTRSPAAVAAVPSTFPFSDPVGELALEGV